MPPERARPLLDPHRQGKAPFTDYIYDNLGIPKNPRFALPPLGFNPADVDLGLGGFLRGAGYAEDVAAATDGAFKVPTLRHLTRTAPFGHNGYFATLGEMVHFYNTRDVAAAGWPAPEVPVNVNVDELGDLDRDAAEEADLVAFLRTLSDRVVVSIPLH